MPGDRVLSGTLRRAGHPTTSEIRFFIINVNHESFTADLHPFPIQRGPNSHLINVYRCFIPISGNRVLAAFLEPHVPIQDDGTSTIVVIRLPERNNSLYSGELEVGEGVRPAWIPRHM